MPNYTLTAVLVDEGEVPATEDEVMSTEATKAEVQATGAGVEHTTTSEQRIVHIRATLCMPAQLQKHKTQGLLCTLENRGLCVGCGFYSKSPWNFCYWQPLMEGRRIDLYWEGAASKIAALS